MHTDAVMIASRSVRVTVPTVPRISGVRLYTGTTRTPGGKPRASSPGSRRGGGA